ncbi:MAG TPA: ATP-binding protein [Vicinamibacteria bacterium]
MQPLTDQQLEELLRETESDRAERKESWSGDAPERGRQAVCAFANDLPNHQLPGVLFVGARDDGSPSNWMVSDERLRTLSDIRSDGKTLPPPTLIIEKRRLLGAEMAVVTVWPSDAPPVRYDGRIWIRPGPRRAVATSQEERILSEKRRHRDRPFESHPIDGCPLGELNRLYFEGEYLPRAFASDILATNERSYEERLASTGMIASVDSPVPTVVGVLTLGTSPRTWLPGAYVQFLRIHGAEWGDPVLDAQEIDGDLETLLRRLDEKLKATLTVAVDFTSGATKEIRSTPYPLVALQQLCRNAVMHRTYEGTNAPVRVYWFDDRIEIHSPGGPYGTVTSENFGNPGVADYRNPNVAGVLKTLGYVQRFGFGIADSRKALRDNGNPPLEFQVQANAVLATVRSRP